MFCVQTVDLGKISERMRVLHMFKYTDNAQIKREIDKLLIDCGISKADIAERLGVSRQRVNNILNKRNLSFADIATLLQSIGYDLCISFKTAETTAETTTTACNGYSDSDSSTPETETDNETERRKTE